MFNVFILVFNKEIIHNNPREIFKNIYSYS